MSQPLLSILIPTVVGREEHLARLLSKFGEPSTIASFPHCDLRIEFKNRPIEIYIAKDEKQITIGEKRENMYKAAKGVYSVQWDDDDDIADNGIDLILNTIPQNPDCITFEEYVNIDGKEYKSNHSLNYPDWNGDGNAVLNDGFHFQRTPFFKSVIKTEIARKVPIPHIRFGEDHQWARSLKPHLHSEIHISEQIYRYLHKSSDFNERYGITN